MCVWLEVPVAIATTGGGMPDRFGAARPRAAREPRNSLRRRGHRASPGLGATIAAVALDVEHGWGNPWMILALAVPVAIDWAYPLAFLRNEEAETMHLDEAYFVIAVLLLPPLGAMAVFLLGTAAGLLWQPHGLGQSSSSTSVR